MYIYGISYIQDKQTTNPMATIYVTKGQKKNQINNL